VAAEHGEEEEEDAEPLSLSPDELEMDPEEMILGWAVTLDSIDYLSLLRLPRPTDPEHGPGDDQIRRAFHAFALVFHPDRHRGSSQDVLTAASTVYRRGAEAYRVLQDPLLRRRYLRFLLEEGALRMPPDEVAQSVRGNSLSPQRFEDIVRSAAALPFARRADELLAAGDIKQAKLQLQLAILKDPNNPRLEERMRDVEERVAAQRARSS
jgi:curved DNA-binding protein CbpA